MITSEKLLKVPDKSQYIINIFSQCTKAESSIIILDGFERIIEWSSLGCRFNNTILQTIMSLIRSQIKSTKKMTIMCTANKLEVLNDLEISDLFDDIYEYPTIISNEDVIKYFPKVIAIDDDDKKISDVFKCIKYLAK
jgi:vesicle-fusing ATPase